VFCESLDDFKIYVDYCASHTPAVDLMGDKTNVPLQEFLEAINP
jgi:hypothetical protein